LNAGIERLERIAASSVEGETEKSRIGKSFVSFPRVERDEESESVRIRNRSSVRERSERGEERRVARLCFAGTSHKAETSVGKTQLCGKKNLSCVGGAYTPPNGAFLLQRWQLVARIKKACGMLAFHFF
jgi:hypothetical protein